MKVGYIGSFGKGNEVNGGQVGKTRNIWKLLSQRYDDAVCTSVSHWKKRPASTLLSCVKIACSSDAVFAVLAENSRKMLLPLLTKVKKYKHNKVLCYIIGGSFPDLLVNDKKLLETTKQCDAIFVQTREMVDKLNKLEVHNAVYSPSFSLRKYPNQVIESYIPENKTYRMFTFSRICKVKGIPEAIEAIQTINSMGQYQIKLDIYGSIDSGYEDEFKKLLANSKDNVSYKGYYGKDDVEDFTKYFAYLFPTHHPGEGFPTTILESMMAGVPIIATDWMYNSELIEDGYDGYLYDGKYNRTLIDTIIKALSDDKFGSMMRVNAYNKSRDYSPDSIMNTFVDYIERK